MRFDWETRVACLPLFINEYSIAPIYLSPWRIYLFCGDPGGLGAGSEPPVGRRRRDLLGLLDLAIVSQHDHVVGGSAVLPAAKYQHVRADRRTSMSVPAEWRLATVPAKLPAQVFDVENHEVVQSGRIVVHVHPRSDERNTSHAGLT